MKLILVIPFFSPAMESEGLSLVMEMPPIWKVIQAAEHCSSDPSPHTLAQPQQHASALRFFLSRLLRVKKNRHKVLG
jgi:hypothetical protein